MYDFLSFFFGAFGIVFIPNAILTDDDDMRMASFKVVVVCLLLAIYFGLPD